MRMTGQQIAGIGKTHKRQPPLRLGHRSRLGHSLMQHQDFRQLVTDGENRIERGHGLLKDHCDLIAPDAAHRLLIGGEQVDLRLFAAKENSALRVAGPGHVSQTHDRHRRDRFAGTALSDDSGGAACADGKAEIIDNAGFREIHRKTLDPKQIIDRRERHQNPQKVAAARAA